MGRIMMTGNSEIKNAADRRPCYSCFHPNAKGTGGAVQFELHPAHDYVEGAVFAIFAAQKTVGSTENGRRVMPTFDWENRITVRLSINEVAQLLEVFRGYRERLCDGNGLFHRTPKANTIITFEHRVDPVSGYVFGVSRKTVDGNLKRISLMLSMAEAIVHTEALAGGMIYMAFGMPKVVARAQKEMPAPAQSETGPLKEVA